MKLIFYFIRKHFFDGPHQHDLNNTPLPEDRPGGYDWGDGRPLGEQQQQHQQQ